jgi:hypothetical protein
VRPCSSSWHPNSRLGDPDGNPAEPARGSAWDRLKEPRPPQARSRPSRWRSRCSLDKGASSTRHRLPVSAKSRRSRRGVPHPARYPVIWRLADRSIRRLCRLHFAFSRKIRGQVPRCAPVLAVVSSTPPARYPGAAVPRLISSRRSAWGDRYLAGAYTAQTRIRSGAWRRAARPPLPGGGSSDPGNASSLSRGAPFPRVRAR